MKQFATGLRVRLLLLVAFAVIPAFGFIGYTAISERHAATARAESNAMNVVRLATREQSQWIAGTRQLLFAVSKLSAVRDPRAGAECKRVLAQLRTLHPDYMTLGAATLDGNVYCSAQPLTRPTNIGNHAYFVRAMQSRDFGIGDYEIGRITNGGSITFGHAVLDDKGSAQAIVFAVLDMAWLNQLVTTQGLPPGSTVTVLDSGGAILGHYPEPEKWIGKSLRGSPVLSAILKRQGEGTTAAQWLDGAMRVHAFAPIEGGRAGALYLSVSIPEASALAVANSSFQQNLVLLFIIAGLVFAAAWFGSQVFVLKPVVGLTNVARRIRSGDFTATAELSHGSGEIGELSRAFEEMAGALYRTNRAHKTLSETKQAVLRATEEPVLLSEICRLIVRQVGYRGALIGYAAEDERRTLQAMAQDGFLGGIAALKKTWENVSWAEGSGPTATAIRTGKPYVAQHLMTDPNFVPWREDAMRHGVESLAVFPIPVDGRVVGALAIYAVEPNAFEPQELNLLTEAVQDLSVGIALLRARLERSRANATIERMAHYDRLTGLPNHALFEERLRRVLSEARSFDRQLAALIVDLNRLRDINDAFGFHRGDQMLKEVAARISAILRPGAVFARMRGDEFAVLCRVEDANDAESVALQILDGMNAPFSIGGVRVDIAATIGVSLYPQDGKDGQQLMRHADVAMHEAKKAAKRYAFYRREQDEDRAQRLAMVGELRRALEANELTLYYQPKVSMRDGRVCGAEALVRWIHPERGMLPPDEFISLAEYSGLIRPLTDWVIGAALRQSSLWRSKGLVLPVAVNLSAHNLRDGALVQKIEHLLTEWDAKPGSLELEITEGAMMEDPEGALDILKRLREMGILLFIDDFGTGYSSLGYLKKLPVDAVKIDKSFVIDMTEDPDSEAIVRTTISLGHELGLKVVAEGIENRTVFDRLATLNCDVAQGYFISKPLPSEALELWMREGSWDPPDLKKQEKPRSRARVK